MAIAAILFSLWYSEISTALEISPKQYCEDNVRNYNLVKSALNAKALPVAVMASLVAAIFLPDTGKIFLESIIVYRDEGTVAGMGKYDAVRTAYCFVTLLSTVLAGYMWTLVSELLSLKEKLNS